MKKILTITFAIIICFAITGCGKVKTETLTKADERVTNINKETKSIRIEVLERNTAYDNVSLGEAWIGYL